MRNLAKSQCSNYKYIRPLIIYSALPSCIYMCIKPRLIRFSGKEPYRRKCKLDIGVTRILRIHRSDQQRQRSSASLLIRRRLFAARSEGARERERDSNKNVERSGGVKWITAIFCNFLWSRRSY